ncbi:MULTISPECIES: hypothetical protein [unclassified Dickeya]|nr:MULTISPECIES: hypothetical protein [unclassified Dickeya]
MSEMITGMPVWAGVLLISTTIYCITFCFKKEIGVKFLLLIPICFLIFSLVSLFQQGAVLSSGFIWLLGFLIGGLAAKRLFASHDYRLGRKAGTIAVPGTYSIITLFLFYFPLRYYIGYRQATAIDHTLSLPLVLLLALSSGGVVGFFTLRAGILFWHYRKLNTKETA